MHRTLYASTQTFSKSALGYR